MNHKLKNKILVYIMVATLVSTEIPVYASNVVNEGMPLEQSEESISSESEFDSADLAVDDITISSEETDIPDLVEKNSTDEDLKDIEGSLSEDVNEKIELLPDAEILLDDTVLELNDEEEDQANKLDETEELSVDDETEMTEESGEEELEELIPSETRINTQPEKDRYKYYAEQVNEDVEESREIKGDIWMAGFEENSLIFTGFAIKQDIRVYDGNIRLTINKDYKITYRNNINAKVYDPDASLTGVPTMTIQMLSGYTGGRSFYYSILKADINDVDISNQEIALNYNGKTQNYVPVITFQGKKLTNGKDYQINYVEDGTKRKGDASDKTEIHYTVEGKGNFENSIREGNDTKTFHYYIVGSDYNFSKATLNIKNKNVKYYGKEITAEQLGITLKIGKKVYTIEDGLFDIDLDRFNEVGTGTITVTPSATAKEDNYVGYVQKTYKIVGGVDLKKSVIVNGEVWEPIMTYSRTKASSKEGLEQSNTNLLKAARDIYVPGASEEESPIVVADTSLVEGTDYSVTYTGNKKTGTAKVTFKGLGKYNGSFSKTFKIIADDTFTVDGPESVSYQKGGTFPELTVKDGDKNTLIKNTDYTVKFTNNTKVGTAHYKVTGKGNYSSKTIVEGDFEIIQSKIKDNCKIQVEDKVYTKKVKSYQSTPVVYDNRNGKKLTAKVDYTVSYQLVENGEAKTIEEKEIPEVGSVIRVTIQGSGNYSGTISSEYKIYDKGKSIKNLYIKIDNQVYTGEKIELTLSDSDGNGDVHVFPTATDMKANSNELNAEEYIRIRPDSYKNNVKNGTASVILETIPGIEYGGSATYKFIIEKKSVKLVGISKVTCVEDKKDILVGDSAELRFKMNPINVDDPKVTISGETESLEVKTPIINHNGEIVVQVSALEMGMCVLTLTVEDYNKKKVSASCFLYMKADNSEVPVVENQPSGYKSIVEYQSSAETVSSGSYKGKIDWTNAFQQAIQSNANIWVPAGTYYVRQINIAYKSNINILMHPNAEIVRLPITAQEKKNYWVNIFMLSYANNILISGGQLKGEKEETDSSHSGEDGHGIMILECSNVTISHMNVISCWADGIYLGIWNQYTSKTRNNQNIVINDCHVNSCRRNGLAITSGENIVVKNSSFNNTRGISPQFGVDIETNESINPVNGVYFDNCTMNGNKAASFGIITKAKNIYLANCTMDGDFHNRACTGLTLDNCKIGGTLYLVHYYATLKNGTTYREMEKY